MKVTLITLNYNGAQNTIKLLESLQNQTDSDFSIIVADNGSSDIQQLRDYGIDKPIHIIENGANLGFAGGNNPALHYAFQNGVNWAVLINNDTWVESDFIARLKVNLAPKKGIVGLPIKEEGGKIAYGGEIEWLKAPSEMRHIYKKDAKITNRYVIGAALAISKEAYEKLGPIDDTYFLYFEDTDYSVQAHENNIEVSYCHEPIVNHAVSQTTGKMGSPLLLRYHYRNALYFNFKNAPLVYKVMAIFWSIFIFIKQLIKILIGKHPTESRAIMAGVVDFYQERMGYISKKIKVGIECEQIEGKIWGVGKIISKTLENISSRPELEKDFEFHLYFKSEIPKLSFLDNPIFHKKIISQPFQHKSFVLYYYLFLPVNLWFERLDVMFFPNYMLPIIFFGNSLVMLTEDIYYEMRSKQQKLQHRLAYRVFATWAKWQANKIMAISETSKKELMRLFDIEPNRIVVNHLAVDPVKNSVSNTNSYFLSPKSYLLFVGQAFPRRHLKESLLAFEKIANDFMDLKFIAIGPDKYQVPIVKHLVEKINTKLGREAIIHKDYVEQEELNQLYAGAKALIYISDREAFGLPPLEALSFGVLPIIADNPLGHELLGDNAVFISNPNSVDSITDGLREAMTNSALHEKIKEHASELVSRYTWPAHTDRFLNIIKSMTHE
ncbi:MAG: glycosyltransferase [bacterium]|nr:glycosyltransferase [bacterium]